MEKIKKFKAKRQMANALNMRNNLRQLQFMTYHLIHLYWYREKDPQANPVTDLVYTTCLALKMRFILYNFPTNPPISII